MKNNNRIRIPHVPKAERISFDYGYHNLPNWLLILFVIFVFSGIICYFYIT